MKKSELTNYEETPFKEVRIASNFLRSTASILGLELKNFRFEEFDISDDKTVRLGFSYDGTANTYGYMTERVKKTVLVKNGDVVGVREGTIAAQDVIKGK